MSDPLERLVASEVEVDRALLADALLDNVRLDVERGSASFTRGARERLNGRQQVVVALLAQKALHLLRPEFPESLRPAELEGATGVPGGTLRPILKVLVDRRLVRTTDRAYSVPAYALEEAVNFIRGEGAHS